MADANAEWSADSNKAINITLVSPSVGGPQTLHSFHPKMTYSIFGDEESIFGYQGLKINLRFSACDMRPGVVVTYTKKFKDVGEVTATDLKGVLEPYLPKTAFEKSAAFESAILEVSTSTWKPPGELWKTIQSGNQTVEVWMGSLADLKIQQMVRRLQILVPFFIEGGTFIDLDDPALDRWTVFFLYQKKPGETQSSPYVFMGYSTVYRYFYLKESIVRKPTNEVDFQFPLPEKPFSTQDARSRISQFLILPPFQGGGNGSRFYNAIFDFYLKDPHTLEMTVEDPNEAFDDLRDLNDLNRLRTYPEFTAVRINTRATARASGPVPNNIVDNVTLDAIREKLKIAPRQFARLMEMQLLSLIPTSIRQVLLLEQERKLGGPETKEKEHEYYLWKLWVKKRLYKHNKDTLIQLDRPERIEKLEQALGSVENDYGRLLRALETRTSPKAGDASQSDAKKGKRSSPEDADPAAPPSKKARVV